MAETDLRLVRLLTRHFPNLRGLNMVLMAPIQVIWGLVWLNTHSGGATILLIGGCFLALYWPAKRLEQYYAERFGRVDVSRSSLKYVITTSLVIPWLLHDRWHPLGTCLAIVWLGAYPAWLVVECWPYRNHHLFVVAASVLAAVSAFRVASPYDGLAQAFVLMGIAEVPCGFADHALLVRAMRARAPAADPSLSVTDWRSEQ